MHSQFEIEKVASQLLETQGLQLLSCRVLQTLWAGYGHVCSVQAAPQGDACEKTLDVILKYVSPPAKSGKRKDEGHLRKVISYQVEQRFYTHLASLMPKDIAVASCLASVDAHSSSGNITAMVMTNLRINFPIAGEKRGVLDERQVMAAVDWLAKFHGFWWTRNQELSRDRLRRPPLEECDELSDKTAGVWLNGGYTYLATRMSEYADLAADETSEWSAKLCSPSGSDGQSLAQRAARFLTPSTKQRVAISSYQTLIHGDVKSENLFTTTQGDAVAFYDFQYVGLGLGVCDLAKLFTCSLPEDMLVEGASDGRMHPSEERLLQHYVSILEQTSGRKYDWHVLVRHWETALVDWLRFQASWGFWGNTEWLEARVRMIVVDANWKTWLEDSLKETAAS